MQNENTKAEMNVQALAVAVIKRTGLKLSATDWEDLHSEIVLYLLEQQEKCRISGKTLSYRYLLVWAKDFAFKWLRRETKYRLSEFNGDTLYRQTKDLRD